MDFRDLVNNVLNTGAGLVGQKYQADAAKANASAAARAAAAAKSESPKWLPYAIVGGLLLLVVGFFAFKK